MQLSTPSFYIQRDAAGCHPSHKLESTIDVNPLRDCALNAPTWTTCASQREYSRVPAPLLLAGPFRCCALSFRKTKVATRRFVDCCSSVFLLSSLPVVQLVFRCILPDRAVVRVCGTVKIPALPFSSPFRKWTTRSKESLHPITFAFYPTIGSSVGPHVHRVYIAKNCHEYDTRCRLHYALDSIHHLYCLLVLVEDFILKASRNCGICACRRELDTHGRLYYALEAINHLYRLLVLIEDFILTALGHFGICAFRFQLRIAFEATNGSTRILDIDEDFILTTSSLNNE